MYIILVPNEPRNSADIFVEEVFEAVSGAFSLILLGGAAASVTSGTTLVQAASGGRPKPGVTVVHQRSADAVHGHGGAVVALRLCHRMFLLLLLLFMGLGIGAIQAASGQNPASRVQARASCMQLQCQQHAGHVRTIVVNLVV